MAALPNHRPRVTVYVPSYNYGHFLPQALASVYAQSFTSWELILINDGSSDDTAAIMQQAHEQDPVRVHLLSFNHARGLRHAANAALELAKGEYITRLDADDYFDESALLVLVSYLDQHQHVGLVFPNWIYVDTEGKVLGVERRKRLAAESEVFDLPAHGACTMIRRRVLKAIGGYEPQFDAQDGHELWIKTLYRHRVAHVETPLFYYRQHTDSMSGNSARLLAARQQIKHAMAASRGPVKPRIAVIVPVKNTYAHAPNLALDLLANKPLLDYTLDSLPQEQFAAILVTTDDPRVVAHCRARGDVKVQLRETELSEPMVQLAEVFEHAANTLEREFGVYADILLILSVHTPLRTMAQIQEAIDTLLVYEVDQVVSTWEDLDLHYRHGRLGMEPVNAGMMTSVRHERESLYAANGSIHALWREFVTPERFLQGRIGHVVMDRLASLQMKKPEERQYLQLLLAQRAAEAGT